MASCNVWIFLFTSHTYYECRKLPSLQFICVEVLVFLKEHKDPCNIQLWMWHGTQWPVAAWHPAVLAMHWANWSASWGKAHWVAEEDWVWGEGGGLLIGSFMSWEHVQNPWASLYKSLCIWVSSTYPTVFSFAYVNPWHCKTSPWKEHEDRGMHGNRHSTPSATATHAADED